MKKLNFEDILRSANKQVHNAGSATALCHFAETWLNKKFPDQKWGRVVSWKQEVLKIEVASSTWSQQIFLQQSLLLADLEKEFPTFKCKNIKTALA